MTEYSLKNIKKKFKENGIFYTPEKLALIVKSFINEDVKEVYDPTCGDGGLLAVFNDNVKKYGQEINKEQLEVAKKRLVNFNGVYGDTLKEPKFDKKFDCIVGNPPFSIKWEPPQEKKYFDCPYIPPKSKADYAFILHIIDRLSDNGIASVLNFPGILYRGNIEGKIRQWLVENNYIDKIISVPPKTFEDTSIATVIIVFKKNKNNTDIFFKELDSNLEKIVKFNEIKKNDFNLSPNLYLIKEIKKEIINPVNIQEDARKFFLESVKKQLEFDRMICSLEKWDSFDKFKKDIIKVINSVKSERIKKEDININKQSLLDFMR